MITQAASRAATQGTSTDGPLCGRDHIRTCSRSASLATQRHRWPQACPLRDLPGELRGHRAHLRCGHPRSPVALDRPRARGGAGGVDRLPGQPRALPAHLGGRGHGCRERARLGHLPAALVCRPHPSALRAPVARRRACPGLQQLATRGVPPGTRPASVTVLSEHRPSGRFGGVPCAGYENTSMSLPPSAPAITTTHGGSFQSASSPSATTTSPKSARSLIALVQTGL